MTTSTGYESGGSVATAAGKKVSTATQCQTDTFSLTGPSGSVPPVICGTNTGEHSKFKLTYSETWLKRTAWGQPNVLAITRILYNQGCLWSKFGFGTKTWKKFVRYNREFVIS